MQLVPGNLYRVSYESVDLQDRPIPFCFFDNSINDINISRELPGKSIIMFLCISSYNDGIGSWIIALYENLVIEFADSFLKFEEP